MTLLRAAAAAFSMYSRLPMPRVAWTLDTMAWALCCFPLVGAVVGIALALWLALAAVLGLGGTLTAVGALAVPLAVTGGIHLDGLCDTADALASHQSRERKLEILKDSHIGAFAAIACGLYLVTLFAVWQAAEHTGPRAMAACLVPVLSRALSGFGALTLPNARGSGMLAAFTVPVDQVKGRMILGVWVLAAATGLIWLDPVGGVGAVCAAGAVFIYYCIMAHRQFGGITGDLAGFFLQLCELGCMLALAAVPQIGEVLA